MGMVRGGSAPDRTPRLFWLAPNADASRRAKRLGRETDIHRAFSARRIPKESLHPSIREDVWSLYHRGKYDTAVFEAMKAVEVAVREAADLSAGDYGTDLMRTAFRPTDGALTDKAAEK